jgi:hypothetical protein
VAFSPSARGTLRLALSGAALSAAAALITGVRGIPCHPVEPILDFTSLAVEIGAAILLGAAFVLETLRQSRSAIEERRADQMMTVALLGLVAVALAGFLVASRLTAC